MSPPSRRAARYSASSSSHRHSLPSPLPIWGHASCGFHQRGRSTHRRGELTAVLRSRLWEIAGGKAVQHLAEAFLGQVLVGILPDQNHRRVDASAKALDFFPTKTSILGKMKGIVMNAALAHLDDIAGAAQSARRGTTDLDVSLFADRLQLKHCIEGRDFQRPDVG